MRRSNCALFAVRAWWRWRSSGAYLSIRKSRHITVWHWLVRYRGRWIHYEPIVPKGLPQPLPSLDADATIEHNAHAILASVIDGSITIEEAGGVLALLKGQADLADRGPMLDAIGTLLKDRGLPLPANLRLREAHGKRD